MKNLATFATAAALLAPTLAPADESAKASPQPNPAQEDHHMDWWHEAKFGMFIHWGIYSVVGGQYKGQDLPNSAEWMMCRGKVPIAEYSKYAEQFNPTKFDADNFVKMAKDAGMKYMVITAKHHDGFSMFDSVWGEYDVFDATPFNRDIMKELSRACNEQGLRFGFYYSQAQDWHHPGGFGNNWDKSMKKVSSDVYVNEKVIPEVKQLLTEYGPISILWWDTPRDMSPEAFENIYSLSSLQPGIITNDRLGKDYPGDHKTFERHIPDRGPVDQAWEVCMPISGSWGYKKGDNAFKSTKELIRNLADIAHKGGNYLLNVSPTGEGVILPQAQERLKEIGEWMRTYSDSIYGTTASPFKKLDFGRCTKKEFAKGTTLYFHVFDWPSDGKLVIPGLKNEIKQAYLMSDWKQLKVTQDDSGTIISVPEKAPNAINSVITVEVGGQIEIEDTGIKQNKDGSVTLLAEDAYIHNNEGSQNAALQDRGDDPWNIGLWTDKEATVEWDFKLAEPATFEVIAEIALEKDSKLSFTVNGETIKASAKATGGYGNYEKQSLGSFSVNSTGNLNIRFKPDGKNWNPINLRGVELKKK
ncbi:alpha-L-fucosidase [Haloferula chungangensis]|uniref:alpha-L-fucosidase n=1 Tax=Haloferula chungangensis TaxID=1048331 RepID=A0ABW2L8B5_9BACT